MVNKNHVALADFFRTGKLGHCSLGELVLSSGELSGVLYLDSGFVKVYSKGKL